jgi:hypothetical protein
MGRPPGPPESVRRNRVATTLTDAELEQLERLAADRGVPVGTALYQLVKRALKPRK